MKQKGLKADSSSAPGFAIRDKWLGICNALLCVTFGAEVKKYGLKRN